MLNNFPVHFARSCAGHCTHLTLKRLPPKALDAWARAISRWGDFAHGSGDLPEVVLAASLRALIGTTSWRCLVAASRASAAARCSKNSGPCPVCPGVSACRACSRSTRRKGYFWRCGGCALLASAGACVWARGWCCRSVGAEQKKSRDRSRGKKRRQQTGGGCRRRENDSA